MFKVEVFSNTHSFFKIFLGHNGSPPSGHRKTPPVLPRTMTDLGMRWDTHPFSNNGLLDPGMTAYDHVFHNNGFLDRYSMLGQGHRSLTLSSSHNDGDVLILHLIWIRNFDLEFIGDIGQHVSRRVGDAPCSRRSDDTMVLTF